MEEDNKILDDKDIEDLIFAEITDEQAINSDDGGGSDAEDILPVNHHHQKQGQRIPIPYRLI